MLLTSAHLTCPVRCVRKSGGGKERARKIQRYSGCYARDEGRQEAEGRRRIPFDLPAFLRRVKLEVFALEADPDPSSKIKRCSNSSVPCVVFLGTP